jgi:NAD(P)-dependent dehydrogenase (short-subunit alcohol dehydrogenase family)
VQTTRAAMPHLRASCGRLLTISSVGGVVGQPFNEAYCAAKFAVEGFMQSLAPVAGTVGVQVAVVEPGAVSSEFVANAGLDVAAMLADAGPYAPALEAYVRRTTSQFGSSAAQTPDRVAEVVLATLAAERMPFRVQTSEWATGFVAASLADLDGSAVQNETSTWVRPPSA